MRRQLQHDCGAEGGVGGGLVDGGEIVLVVSRSSGNRPAAARCNDQPALARPLHRGPDRGSQAAFGPMKETYE